MERHTVQHFTNFDKTIYISYCHIDSLHLGEMNDAYQAITNRKTPIDIHVHFKRFIEMGYTEERVSNAPVVLEPNKLILFSSDENFRKLLGVAVMFDEKFYVIRGNEDMYDLYSERVHKKSTAFGGFINTIKRIFRQ